MPAYGVFRVFRVISGLSICIVTADGGTLTGREPDNATDHAERPPARVPRLRGKARFMGSTRARSSTGGPK